MSRSELPEFASVDDPDFQKPAEAYVRLPGFSSVYAIWPASREGTVLIIADRVRGVQALDVETQALVAGVHFQDELEPGDDRVVVGAALTSDGVSLRWFDIRGRLWTSTSPHERPVCLQDIRCNGIWSASFSPSGRTLFAARRDQKVQALNCDSGMILWTTERLPHHSCRPTAVCFDEDGLCVSTFSAADSSNRIRVWDLASGQVLATHQGIDGSYIYWADGHSAFVGVSTSTSRTSQAIMELNLKTGGYVVCRDVHSSDFTAMAIHRPTRRLWIGTLDGKLLMHPLNGSDSALQVVGQRDSLIRQIVVFGAGRHIAMVLADGSVWCR